MWMLCVTWIVYGPFWEICVISNCAWLAVQETHFMLLFDLSLPLVYLFLYWLINFLTGTNMIRVIGKYVYLHMSLSIYTCNIWTHWDCFGCWTTFCVINQTLHWFWSHSYAGRIFWRDNSQINIRLVFTERQNGFIDYNKLSKCNRGTVICLNCDYVSHVLTISLYLPFSIRVKAL